MPITSADIKLMQSERLTDNADGGGRMSGNEVVDGVSNNLFPDISSLDRVYGRVNLRKAFASVLTDTTDVLLGAHAILDSLPADTNVTVVMFQTGSHTDERADAAAAQDYPAATPKLLGSISVMAAWETTIQFATAYPPKPDDLLKITYVFSPNVGPSLNFELYTSVISISLVSGQTYDVTLNDSLPGGGGYLNYSIYILEGAKAYGAAILAAPESSGNSLTVSGVQTRLAPSYSGADPAIIGLDPTKLPPNGLVYIFRPGDLIVVHETTDTTMPNPLSAGQVVALPRGDLASCLLLDQAGTIVATAKYTVDLTAGTVTMATPLDLTVYTEPLIARHRIEDMLLVSAVDEPTNTLTTAGSITHSFPATTTLVSSAALIGDTQARVVNIFDQQTWANAWADAVSGSAASSTYNSNVYPLAVTNRGAIKERWAIVFTSATAFKVIGETVGEIALGDTATDCAPVNPATGAPYFTIQALGWGTGWSGGNAVRFNTEGANSPLWIARCVIQGDPSQPSDSFAIQIRGDVNA